MHLNSTKLPPEDADYLDIHVITSSGSNITKIDNVVGFCHSSAHRGYITKTILNTHGCLKKNCTRCEIYTEYPYWKEHQSKENHALTKKQSRKQELKNAKKAQKYNLRRLEFIKRVLNSQFCDNTDEFFVTGITEDSPRHYIINYTSKYRFDDSSLFVKMLSEAGMYLRGNGKLRHIMADDGKPMLTKDYMALKL